jgi:Uma2 family endonuclease
MAQTAWRRPPLTKEQRDLLIMLTIESDEEDAPWMVMGDLQFWSASSLAHSLHIYARRRQLDWYVASMMPIYYSWSRVPGKKFFSPDLFVAFVADHPRTSFDADDEGGFPPFVLEVTSESSRARDEEEKRVTYELLGVSEYMIFSPRETVGSTLQGYRRGADGSSFERWEADEHGRLWSDLLGLWFEVQGRHVQARTQQGELLLTPEQEAEARYRAEEALRQEMVEVERLRRELERYRKGGAE